MKYSILAQIDKQFRTRAFIKSRINRINYHVKNIDQNKYPFNHKKVRADLQQLKNMVLRLDNNHIITTGYFLSIFGQTDMHLIKLFGINYKKKSKLQSISNIDTILNKMMEKTRLDTRNARISELQYRMKIELEIAHSNKEFAIFNTLTVNDYHYDKVFKTKSNKYWSSYQRRWNRNTTNHRYFAVIERGDKNGRLHIHCLHIFTTIKKGLLQDPNKYFNIPDKREITQLKCFWKYGTSSPIAVRYGQNDTFGLLSWRWPVKFNEKLNLYQPIPQKPPQALACYMSKYILKNYQTTKEKFPWRTRLSRQFGLLQIKNIMSNISNKSLRSLMKIPSLLNNPANRSERKIPTKLVEKHSHLEWLNRKKKSHPELIQRIRRMLNPRPSLKLQLLALITMKPNRNLRNTLYSLTPIMKKMVAFELIHVKQNVEWYLLGEPQTIKSMGVTQRVYA